MFGSLAFHKRLWCPVSGDLSANPMGNLAYTILGYNFLPQESDERHRLCQE